MTPQTPLENIVQTDESKVDLFRKAAPFIHLRRPSRLNSGTNLFYLHMTSYTDTISPFTVMLMTPSYMPVSVYQLFLQLIVSAINQLIFVFLFCLVRHANRTINKVHYYYKPNTNLEQNKHFQYVFLSIITRSPGRRQIFFSYFLSFFYQLL